MSNQGHEVEIREFKEDGLDDTTLKFSSLKQLDDYLGWPHSYSGGIIRKSRHDLIRNKFILHDLSEPHKWYIVWKFEGKIVATEMEIGDEALVMSYLDILKYAKYHCPDDEDPYEITDRIFIDMLKANGENNEN